jgi:hypothetical protein
MRSDKEKKISKSSTTTKKTGELASKNTFGSPVYFVVILLGFLGFIGTSGTLILISNDTIIIDEWVYVFDQDLGDQNFQPHSSIKYDQFRICNNGLGLTKKPSSVVDQLEIKKHNYITYGAIIFNLNPDYLIWIMLVGLAVGIALASWPITFHLMKNVSTGLDKPTRRWTFIGAIVFLSMILGFAQMGFRSHMFSAADVISITGIMFDHAAWTMLAISLLIISPNFLALTGNFRIVMQMNADLSLEDHILLHKKFTRFLIISSMILVLGVVTTTYFRLSVLGFFPVDYGYLFPDQFVFAYSLVFTFSLVLLFLPVDLAFRYQLFQRKKSASETESKIIDHLLAQGSIFKLGFSLLAPVIANILLDGLSAFL